MRTRFFTIVVVISALVLGACSDDEVTAPPGDDLPEAPPQYVSEWGSQGNGQGEFNDPWDVAVDKHGDVFVVDRTNHRIQKFNGDGNFLVAWSAWGVGPQYEFNYPEGIAVDTTDTVFVADRGNNRIVVFDPGHDFVREWIAPDPAAIALDHERYVYVAIDDYYVSKYDANGTYIGTIGGKTISKQPGQFNVIGGVAAGSTVFYVTDMLDGRVQQFGTNGSYLMQWGTYGQGDGQFVGATGIALDPDGNVYVVDHTEGRVQKFDEAGVFLTKWGSQGQGNGQFQNPWGIAIGEDGTVYVADAGNDRVQVFK